MTSTHNDWPTKRRITIRDLQAAKERGELWTMLTSYDALTASLFEDQGVRVLLVGDTAAMVVYGHETTVPVTVDELLALVKGVVRGTRKALVVADMPFGSYQVSMDQAVTTAIRCLKEGGAQAVKLEGGHAVMPQVEAIAAAGVPVMGHLGLTPQSVHVLGGFRVQGRGSAGDELIVAAQALQAAGAFALVVEAVPADLGRRVTESVAIPVIGIGAGSDCDAQVMVWQDLAGLTPGRVPKFVKQYADLRTVLGEAVAAYVADVRSGQYPAAENTYE